MLLFLLFAPFISTSAQLYVCAVLMYVPYIVYNLLFRPSTAQYIDSNVYFVKYSFLTCFYVFTSLGNLFLYILKLQNQ